MTLKRIVPLATLALAAGLATSCTRDADAPTPLEPEFAKGGKPGAPTDPGVFELLEYYVYRDAGGQRMVHVVGKGDVPSVNLDAVQDFHFNGIRDDDYGDHYEYYTFPPSPVAVTESNPDGTFHMDVLWDGARHIEGGQIVDLFRDFPTSDVDGSGADPYSFDVRFQKEDGSFLDQWQPQGIILGGVDTHQAEMDPPTNSAYHSFGSGQKIYSYATFKGAEPVGEVHLEEVYVDPATLACVNQKSLERVDGQKVVVWSTVITGHARIRTASSDLVYPESAKLWLEWHFVDVTSDRWGNDTSDWRFTWRGTLNRDTADLLVEGDFGGRIHDSEPVDGMWVSFVVDYVFPTWYPYDKGGWVYRPELNTDAGFTTIGHVATQVGDHGAIAFTTPEWVTCR